MSDTKQQTVRFPGPPMCRWSDVPSGEGALLSDGALVVRIEPSCEFADGLRPDEVKHMGVVIKSDDMPDIAPGTLMCIGPDSLVQHVVWHGERRPL